MTTLTAPDVKTTSKPPSGPGRLRLRRAGVADKWFEFAGGKCTIGSSSRCHVCLPAAEAQPLQCLLSLEAGAAFATKWASGVLLNGQTFAKAKFDAGDRLSIGPWEIEWESRESAPRKPDLRKSEPRAGESMPTAPSRPASRDLQGPANPTLSLRETVDFAPVERLLPKAPEPVTLVEPASARLRETIDFSPVARPSEPGYAPPAGPEAAVPAAPPVVVAPTPSAPAKADVRLTPAPKRPAAKTMLIASRETDPFADLLGPAKPIAELPPAAPADSRSNSASQTFEDRLVASLWVSNFAARKRAKNLAAAARKARSRVEELTACVATLERRLTETASVSEAEAAELQATLASLRSELSSATADRDRAAAELVALQNARPRTAPPDPRLQTLADAVAKSEQEAVELRKTLAACQEQIETLRQERAEAESALAAAKAAHESAVQAQAAAEQRLAESNSAGEQPSRDSLAAERAEREEERKLADEEATRLRDQLYACESQIEALRGQVVEADATRDALSGQLAAVQQQQNDWLTQCKTLEQHRAAELAEMTGQRDELQRQLDEIAAHPAATSPAALGSAAAATPSPATTESSVWRAPSTEMDSADAYAEENVPTPAALSEPIWRGWDAATELAATTPEDEASYGSDLPADEYTPFASAAPTAEDAIDESAAREPYQDESTAGATTAVDADDESAIEDASTAHVEVETDRAARLTPAAAAVPQPQPEAPTRSFTPTSFIDKYRHLLDDESETPQWQSSAQRQLLDEEHMSPSKPTPASSVEEDSDEALEAYMSNMMRRMRSGSAPAAPAPEVVEAPEPVLSRVEMMAKSAMAAEQQPEEPQIELDANGMLRLVRKPQPPSADLTALRELANSTARTAIAEHHQRRHFESAVTKGIIFAAASAASAYLMLTAPSVESPWFWGGCATMVMAAGAAAQLGVIAWQRLRQGGRSAAATAG